MAKRVQEGIEQNVAKRRLLETPVRSKASIPNVAHFKLGGSPKRKSRIPKRLQAVVQRMPVPHQPNPSPLSGKLLKHSSLVQKHCDYHFINPLRTAVTNS